MQFSYVELLWFSDQAESKIGKRGSHLGQPCIFAISGFFVPHVCKLLNELANESFVLQHIHMKIRNRQKIHLAGATNKKLLVPCAAVYFSTSDYVNYWIHTVLSRFSSIRNTRSTVIVTKENP